MSVSGQTLTLTQAGKPSASIIVNCDSKIIHDAAQELNFYIQAIAATELPIVKKASKKDNTIEFNLIAAGTDSEITEDGFRIVSTPNSLSITANDNDRGALYAIATIAKRYWGVNYWAFEEFDAPRQESLVLPSDISLTENPSFRYRQSQSYGSQDAHFRTWYRLEEPRELFADGLWVHTFKDLLPHTVYGETNPEYYSLINGKRRPGREVQWCLTNPAVLDIVVTKLDSIFKANPEQSAISISQNDGNMTQCTCQECAAIDAREGSYSGNLVLFMNKIAERFPDKTISTLAYLFSMQPPLHARPLPNVNIMLCSIDSKREVSLPENESGQDFMKALTGWGKITDNIFVWDYGINFDNVVAPFPNFHILKPNINHFYDNGATMVFEQINSTLGTDFSELRTYMVSELMWNKSADADSLVRHFVGGYYGEAGDAIYEYLKIREGALIGSGIGLWIYDTPVTHKEGMLNAPLRKIYNNIFDRAERAVTDNEEMLRRVHIARLPLLYSELEIARTEDLTEPTLLKETTAKLNLFEHYCTIYNIPTLNERQNSPLDYAKLYRERYLKRRGENLARGCTVSFDSAPSGNYAKNGAVQLTDGLLGGGSFVESWVGWEGKDGAFTLDLGSVQDVRYIGVDFLHQIGQWIFYPSQVTYSYIDENGAEECFGVVENPEERGISVMYKELGVELDTAVKTQYIKVTISGVFECPSWHYGIGRPGWFFADEIFVR